MNLKKVAELKDLCRFINVTSKSINYMYCINAIIGVVSTDTRMLKWLNVMKVEIYLHYTILYM